MLENQFGETVGKSNDWTLKAFDLAKLFLEGNTHDAGINVLRLRGVDVKQSPKHESKRSTTDCRQELFIDGSLAGSVEVSDFS